MIETLSAVATKKVVRKHPRLSSVPARWTLPVILALQAVVAMLVLHNSVFQDEGLYLLAGRQIFQSWFGGPRVIDPYGLYFSGYPSFYPVIGGVLDMLGGLELARTFSTLCMLGVTTCIYLMTRKLFSQYSAIFAAALFACLGPVLFLSRLATYDALCLLLLALAMTLTISVSTTRRAWWAASGIGPLLLLAVAAKYAGLLFVPTILATLVLCSVYYQGWGRMLQRFALMLIVLIIVVGLAYLNVDKTVLTGLSLTTTNRTAIVHTPLLTLLRHILTLDGVAYLLALVGLVLVGKKRLLLALLLFGSAWLAPAYHIYKGELVSLDKHLAFSAFFAMPLAGVALSTIAGYRPKLLENIGQYWLTGLAICLLVFLLGVQQAQNNFAEWEPTGDLTALLHTQVRPGSGRYLAEEYDVERYSMQDVTYSWQWSSLDFFSYTDKVHHQLTGRMAYNAAIQNGYFDLIELNYGYDTATAQAITSYIKISGQYDLIAKIPYHNVYGNGFFWVWRKHTPTLST